MSEIKRPDNIPGYVHPTVTNFSRKGIYKTFTEGKKASKKEKFGNTTVGKQYANNTDLEQEPCPLCNNISIYVCPCSYNDKRCGSGHSWYTDREGKIKNGNPHM